MGRRTLKYRELVKMLEADGWYLHRKGKGNHQIYKHPRKPGSITIDYKASRDVSVGTLHAILRQAGLKGQEKGMESRRYLVVIERADDGTYGAYSPDVPGCAGSGTTPGEALDSYRESLDLWIEEAVTDGLAIPEARSSPAEVDVQIPQPTLSTQR